MTLSRPAAFALQASIVVFFLAGSSAPTPLYPVYQAEWGFSPVTTTLVFGVYALAVLGALLVAGSLSDYVGRRPVLLVAALMQAVTMLLFATAHGVSSLLAARVLQGLATGGATGAVGAGLMDLDRQRGTVMNAIAPALGTATGALGSGLLVEFAPAPTLLVYALLGSVFVLQAAAVLVMPETVTRRPGALRALRPHFALPAQVRKPLLLAAPALFGAWALAGFYGSLGPTLVRRLLGSNALALGGVALFALAWGAVVTVLVALRHTARGVMTFGTAALVAGVGVTLFAIAQTSVALFFVGTVIAGAGFGGAFQGAIRSVVPLAEPHERAGVLSVVYLIAYLGMGLPAVVGGYRVAHGGGVFGTAREYGLSVMLLAAIALVGSLRREREAAVPASSLAGPLSSRAVPSRP